MSSLAVSALVVVLVVLAVAGPACAAPAWTVGKPIVTYWAGPAMTDATAKQMADGNWNLVWCSEKELDVAQHHGLRAMLQDGLLTPATLDDNARRGQLDALIARVKQHPAMCAYFITDEPNAAVFPGLGKLVAYLRERDPGHLAYINLFPTYASNEQLGTKGDVVAAYREHLRQFVEVVKPGLISYDHYHFTSNGDGAQYFLNLALIRECALANNLPFLNIVQAATWTPSMRVPNGPEVRWLVNTSLAYGAQGISYYVYCCAGHTGAIANPDGTPTRLYATLRVANRDFAAMAAQLQRLRSLGAYHLGEVPQGATAPPAGFPFEVRTDTRGPKSEKGGPNVLVGTFGPAKGTPTHLVVVNLDYKSHAAFTLSGPGSMQVFNPHSATWGAAEGNRVRLSLQAGGASLVRLAQ